MTRHHAFTLGLRTLILLVPMMLCAPVYGQELWTDVGNGIVRTLHDIEIGASGTAARIWINDNSTRFNIRNSSPGPTVIDYGSAFNFRQGPAGGLSTMYFDPVGNVGIGTTTPKSKLAVNGTILATEVVVQTNINDYPDFVFEDGYELMPLDELEATIERQGHLPGIPSAAEAAQNGVGVGDMQNRLLQKVEELTLYMIELQKKNDALESQIEALSQQN